ncbi:MAG: capsular polysaccharide synthesis protein [Mangrovicoccus sp.]
MSENRIPKTIYMLWDKPRPLWPGSVELCVDLWTALNPGWNVTVLDGGQLEQILRRDFPGKVLIPMSVQMKSDLLRLKLLSEKGGVWADATCLPLKPMFKWFGPCAHLDFAAPGFDHLRETGQTHPQGRDYGNWFIASKKGSYVASRLYQRLQEFFDRPRFALPYAEPLQTHIAAHWRDFIGPSADQLSVFPYHTMHYLTAREIEADSKFRKLVLQSAVPAGVYNYVMKRMAYPQMSPKQIEEVSRFLRNAPVPINKLDWKIKHEPDWGFVRDILWQKRPGASA